MAVKLMEMEALIHELDTNFPELEWGVDRDWVWLTSNLAPVHRNKCQCESCAERARLRKAIGKDGLGFSFAPRGHVLEDGEIGHWAHRTTHPVPFKRRSKGRPESASNETVSDSELLEMIGG